MGLSVTYRILSEHLADGDLVPGNEIGIRIDQTLTQDATGTMAYLQFEAMGIPRVRTLSVSYVDHNTIQMGFENADDHRYLQTMNSNYGIFYSRAGNEFSVPVISLASFSASLFDSVTLDFPPPGCAKVMTQPDSLAST